MNSVFCCFYWEKSTECCQNLGLVNEFSATPRGQLNWTSPIANSSCSLFLLQTVLVFVLSFLFRRPFSGQGFRIASQHQEEQQAPGAGQSQEARADVTFQHPRDMLDQKTVPGRVRVNFAQNGGHEKATKKPRKRHKHCFSRQKRATNQATSARERV